MERYQYDIDKRVFIEAFIGFRLGISELYMHSQRYITGADEILCPLCREEFETEIHFLLTCPALNDLRDHYIFKFMQGRNSNPVEWILA